MLFILEMIVIVIYLVLFISASLYAKKHELSMSYFSIPNCLLVIFCSFCIYEEISVASSSPPYFPSMITCIYMGFLFTVALFFPFISRFSSNDKPQPHKLFSSFNMALHLCVISLLFMLAGLLHYWVLTASWSPSSVMIPWGAAVLYLIFISIPSLPKIRFSDVNLGFVSLRPLFFTSDHDSDEFSKGNTLLLYVVIAAIPLYTIDIFSIPTDVHGDVGEVAFVAQDLMEQGNYNFFQPAWFGIPNMFFLFPALTTKLFGFDLIGMRIQGVLFGLLSIPVCFYAFKNTFGARLAFVCAFVLATTTMYIQFARMGIGYNQSIFFYLIVYALLQQFVRTQQPLLLVWVGFFSAISFCSYQANKILFPLALLTIFLSWVYFRINTVTLLRSLGIVLISFILVAMPLLIQYFNNPTESVSRFNSISIFSDSGYQRIIQENRAETDVQSLLLQAGKTIFAPISVPDSSPFFINVKYGGMFDNVSSMFLVVGVVVVLSCLRSFSFALPLYWILPIIFASSFMTVSAPQYQRMIGSIPFFVFFVSVGVVWSWTICTKWIISKQTRDLILLLLLLIIFVFSYDNYFWKIMKEKQFTDDSTRVAKLLMDYEDTHYIYFCGLPHYGMNYGNIRFMVNAEYAMNVENLESTVEQIPHRAGPVLFVLIGTNMQKISLLRERFPFGKELTHTNIHGHDPFITYEYNF